MIRRPPRSTLFPYTTLFRSWPVLAQRVLKRRPLLAGQQRALVGEHAHLMVEKLVAQRADVLAGIDDVVRSEEHTSELQSRLHLVCRLLLEKKKNYMSR